MALTAATFSDVRAHFHFCCFSVLPNSEKDGFVSRLFVVIMFLCECVSTVVDPPLATMRTSNFANSDSQPICQRSTFKFRYITTCRTCLITVLEKFHFWQLSFKCLNHLIQNYTPYSLLWPSSAPLASPLACVSSGNLCSKNERIPAQFRSIYSQKIHQKDKWKHSSTENKS